MTMNKSWKITIAAIITAVAMIILPTFGIDMAESQIQNMVLLALGIGGIGGAVKVSKKITEKTKSKDTPQHEEKLTPQLQGTWYKTNMIVSNNGNALPYGEPYLYAQITNTKSYTTAKLSRHGKLIQIDQSAAGEPVRLEMFERVDGVVVPMARGQYELQLTGDRGTSDSTGVKDLFDII